MSSSTTNKYLHPFKITLATLKFFVSSLKFTYPVILSIIIINYICIYMFSKEVGLTKDLCLIFAIFFNIFAYFSNKVLINNAYEKNKFSWKNHLKISIKKLFPLLAVLLFFMLLIIFSVGIAMALNINGKNPILSGLVYWFASIPLGLSTFLIINKNTAYNSIKKGLQLFFSNFIYIGLAYAALYFFIFFIALVYAAFAEIEAIKNYNFFNSFNDISIYSMKMILLLTVYYLADCFCCVLFNNLKIKQSLHLQKKSPN